MNRGATVRYAEKYSHRISGATESCLMRTINHLRAGKAVGSKIRDRMRGVHSIYAHASVGKAQKIQVKNYSQR